MRQNLQPSKYLYLIIITIFGLLLSGCALDLSAPATETKQQAALDDQLQPAPDLSPEDVVRIQVEALQNNDEQDKGIEVTFRFASPANKQATGPLGRFIRMVKDPAYSPMLNHKTADYDPIEIEDNSATQRVTIINTNGKATVYLFKLSKQAGPPCNGCWMTDSVTVVPTRKQDLQGA